MFRVHESALLWFLAADEMKDGKNRKTRLTVVQRQTYVGTSATRPTQ